jgi:hypothetical protein
MRRAQLQGSSNVRILKRSLILLPHKWSVEPLMAVSNIMDFTRRHRGHFHSAAKIQIRLLEKTIQIETTLTPLGRT